MTSSEPINAAGEDGATLAKAHAGKIRLPLCRAAWRCQRRHGLQHVRQVLWRVGLAPRPQKPLAS